VRIFLVGLPGAGKSTFGKRLSKYLNLEFYDLDQVIESQAHTSISQIFSSEGEHHFREIERKALKNFIESNEEYLLATGGGTPCFFDQMNVMIGTGLTVYLDVSIETIVERVNRNDKRPLLKGENAKNTVSRLHSQRHQYYSKADLVLKEEDLKENTIELAMLEIKKAAFSRFH
jgi:shikimate kinase